MVKFSAKDSFNSDTGVKNGEFRVKTRVKNDFSRVETREKIINLMKEKPTISSKEIASKLTITQKGVEWQLKKLRDDKIIKHIGSKKGGYWEIIKDLPVEGKNI